jgi:hypothetical protein
MKCHKCNGKGLVDVIVNLEGLVISITCNHCYQKPDLDWLEYIIGVDRDWGYVMCNGASIPTKEYIKLYNSWYPK